MMTKKIKSPLFCSLFCLILVFSSQCFARNFILSKHSTFSTFDLDDYSPLGKMYIKVLSNSINNSNVNVASFRVETSGKEPISGELVWDSTLSAFINEVALNSFEDGDVLDVTLTLTGRGRSGNINETEQVTIGEDVPVADAGPGHFNVGYGTTVTIDGSTSTGKDITFEWSISNANGSTLITLVDNEDGTASFTLPNFDDIVNPEPYQPVYDKAKVFAMTYDMMGSYEVRLEVTDDQGRSSSDYVEITATSRSSGLENVPLGKPVYFVAPDQETFKWTLSSKPNNSNSTLNESTSRIANFVPDVEGIYTIQEENSGSSIDIGVGTFVGVGKIDEGKRAKFPSCSKCHRIIHKTWLETHHSIALTNKYNGFLTDGETPFPFFREFCVKCHVTGLDSAATTTNDGFDDQARKEGWTYPLPDENGNVDSENFTKLIGDFSQTAEMAQVQCEMCHGPGSRQHVFDKTGIDRTLHPTTCGQCHAFVPTRNRYVEWLGSAHARSVRMGVPFLTGVPAGVNTDNPLNGCGTQCHTVEGFLRFRVQDRVPPTDLYSDSRNDAAPVSCVLCHSPMSNFGNMDDQGNPIEDGRKQLRFYGKTTIPKWNNDETEVINVEVDAGPAAICTKCHLHGMYLSESTDNGTSVPQPFKVGDGAPIHQQAQVYFGIGGSEYDPDEFGLGPYPEPTHAKAFRDVFDEPKYCVHCHMLRYGTRDEQFGKLGSHTWEMEFETIDEETGEEVEFENGKPCFDCHEGAKDGNAPGGYSFTFGDEGEDFLKSLLDQLKNILPQDERGNVVWDPAGDDFGTPADPSDDIGALTALQAKAAFNYYFIENDGSDGHHNMAYAVRLIGDAIRSLGETPIERKN